MVWQASLLTFGVVGIAAAAVVTTGIFLYYKYRTEKPHSNCSNNPDQGIIVTFDDLAGENPLPKAETRNNTAPTKEIGIQTPLAERILVETSTQTSEDIVELINAQQSNRNHWHSIAHSRVNTSASVPIPTSGPNARQGASSSPATGRWKKRGCDNHCRHKDPSGFLRVKKRLLRERKLKALEANREQNENENFQRSVVRSLPTGGNLIGFNIDPETSSNLSLSLNDLDDYDDDDDASVVTIGSDTDYPPWNEMPLEDLRSLKCKACQFRKVETVTYPCKHPYLCSNCATVFFKNYNRCLVCRNMIKSFDPVYV